MTDTPTPEALLPTSIKRLDSGYWHVKFGPQIFVQWPVGYYAQHADVFHGGDDADRYARAASLAVGMANAELAECRRRTKRHD